jgi:Fe-S-cluster containining protein
MSRLRSATTEIEMSTLSRKAVSSRGFVCNNMGCCCWQTEMELLPDDITRLVKMGFKPKDFSYKDGNTVKLRNVKGHCFFLEPTTSKCRIYRKRPLGCRIYPVILLDDKAVVDRFCPNYNTLNKRDYARKKFLLLKHFSLKTKISSKRSKTVKR